MAKFRIDELCSSRGISQKVLGEMINVSPTSLSRIMNGKQAPSMDTLEKIASVLNVPLWQLFTQSKASSDFMALVKDKDNYYHATSVEELEEVLSRIKQSDKEK